MNNKYDVIIIGAGIGGLSAGTYLSKAGYRVLIIEKQRHAGGYCSSFKRKGFVFDSAAHVVGSYNKNCSFWNLIRKLDIDVDFIRMCPTDRIRFKGEETIEIPVDYKEYVEYLKNMFSKEVSQIDAFFLELCKMTNPLYASSVVKKYARLTYQQYLDSYFSDDRLKSILSAYCGFVGLPPSEASALAVLFTFKMFLIEGAYYPKGGAQSLADAFVSRFIKNGGEIIFDNEVNSIMIHEGVATGIAVRSGEQYYADSVISNIDANKSSLIINDTSKINTRDYLCIKRNKYKVGMSCFIIYLATNAHVETAGKNGWYYDSIDINRTFKDLIYLHIPSNYDNTVTKEGCNVIIMIIPYMGCPEDAKDWNRVKKELTDQYLRKLNVIFPKLSSNILEIDAATPDTLQRYTSNTLGSAYGWRQNPEQMYLNAFPAVTSIKGLYLAGHWTFPGGGVVSVAISGLNAARHITRGASGKVMHEMNWKSSRM